ncbi:MAG: hypothetical protein GXP08_14770 [Gammaproteobacteria bacterium]|nr:hypothetical protein [Gammaproteobacteria bacterium]
MNENKVGYSRFWGVLPLLMIAALAWYMQPSTLKFEAQGLNNLPMILGYLILISLFVERAIEVFLSAWRSAGADALDRKIEIIEKKLKKIIDSHENYRDAVATLEYQDNQNNLELVQTTRTQYRADSRFISQWFGLGIGVTIAFVGIRVLDNVVSATSLSGSQQTAFIIVDIILTGAVIAGGSNSINKIMKVYNSFMETTVKRTKA